MFRGIGEVGIALEWHSRGQGFESPMLHQYPGRDYPKGDHTKCGGFLRMPQRRAYEKECKAFLLQRQGPRMRSEKCEVFLLQTETLEMASFQGFFLPFLPLECS